MANRCGFRSNWRACCNLLRWEDEMSQTVEPALGDGSMDRNLALEVVRVTEVAAIAAARLMGRGEKNKSDQAAVDAMRRRCFTSARRWESGPRARRGSTSRSTHWRGRICARTGGRELSPWWPSPT